MSHKITPAYIALFAATFAGGCAVQSSDDGSAYREALPEASRVRVAGPEGGEEGGAALEAHQAVLADDPATAGGVAKWYSFTREFRNGVNGITAGVLGMVWLVVHLPPTTVGDDFAEWGPHTDALEPVTWRLRVTRVDDHEYDYELQGRPRASDSEGDFLTVLDGKGYDRADPRHGDGFFTVNVSNGKELDPAGHKPEDSGTVTITHDLPQDLRRGALPRTITAEIEPDAEPWVTVVSTANVDGTGELNVSAHADVDDTKMTELEDIAILSRWRATGAGRADITITGGDLVPAEIDMVTASECWGTDFTRSFYQDSIGAEPAEGDETTCAFDASN